METTWSSSQETLAIPEGQHRKRAMTREQWHLLVCLGQVQSLAYPGLTVREFAASREAGRKVQCNCRDIVGVLELQADRGGAACIYLGFQAVVHRSELEVRALDRNKPAYDRPVVATQVLGDSLTRSERPFNEPQLHLL